jgi:serine/threonine protein phosphatase PrpC
VPPGTGPSVLAVISDGVSTSPQAQEASQIAAQAAARLLLTSLRRGEDPAEASMAAVRQGHLALSSLGSPGRNPSATYISAVADSGGVTICWLGDSRAYWLETGPNSRRLTADDSLAEEMVARGELAESEALTSPQAHVITRWLGAEGPDPRAHLTHFEPPGPGVVLVCSDGLWNYQPDAAGLAELALPTALTEPLGALRTLLSFAIGAGGADNITAVLIPLPLAPAAPDNSE